MSDTPRPQARVTLNRFGTLALLCLLPSMTVFGWRAAVLIAGVIISYALARWILRDSSGSRRPSGMAPRMLPIEALVVCTLLPAELASAATWPLVAFAGTSVALLRWVRSVVPGLPFDPALLAVLSVHAVAMLTGRPIDPVGALERNAIVTGDVVRTGDTRPPDVLPWYSRPQLDEGLARRSVWSADAIDDYLRDRNRPANTTSNLDALIRDRLPPLEDLVLLGHPMPLGQASGIWLIAVVLWGAHRRTIDWRVPIIAGASAYLILLVLPVPTSFSSHGGNWRALALLRPDVGVSTALTFVHYLIFSSTLPITLGMLAPRLDTKPMRAGATIMWSSVVGALAAACTLYVSVPLGALFAVAIAPMLARGLDDAFARRPMRLPA